MQHEGMSLSEVLKMIARPAEPYHADPLPPGERCPLIGRGCGASNVCSYSFVATPDPGHFVPKRMADGHWGIVQVSTVKSKVVDGRCVTKMQALEHLRRLRENWQ